LHKIRELLLSVRDSVACGSANAPSLLDSLDRTVGSPSDAATVIADGQDKGCYGRLLARADYELPVYEEAQAGVFNQITHVQNVDSADGKPDLLDPATSDVILKLATMLKVNVYLVLSLWLEASMGSTQAVLPSLYNPNPDVAHLKDTIRRRHKNLVSQQVSYPDPMETPTGSAVVHLLHYNKQLVPISLNLLLDNFHDRLPRAFLDELIPNLLTKLEGSYKFLNLTKLSQSAEQLPLLDTVLHRTLLTSLASATYKAAKYIQFTHPEIIKLLHTVKLLSNDQHLTVEVKSSQSSSSSSLPSILRPSATLATAFKPSKRDAVSTGNWNTLNSRAEKLAAHNILVIAAHRAMSPRDLKLDRATAMPNSFGEGNALLPPSSPNVNVSEVLSNLRTIRNCVFSSSKHKPTEGIVFMAFANLLAPHIDEGPIKNNYDQDFIRMLQLPLTPEYRSVSFLNNHVLPGLSLDTDAADYVLTIGGMITEYAEQCLCQDEFPGSTGSWVEDRYLEIETEFNNKQFDVNNEGDGTEEESVDELLEKKKEERPDTADDILTLVASTIALRPNDVGLLWFDFKNRPMLEHFLRLTREKDQYLLAPLLGLLASLANVDAELKEPDMISINDILMGDNDMEGDFISWQLLLPSIKQLSDILLAQPSSARQQPAPLPVSTDPNAAIDSMYTSANGYNSNPYIQTQAATAGTEPVLLVAAAPPQLDQREIAASTSILTLLYSVASNSTEARDSILSQTSVDIIPALFSLFRCPLQQSLRGLILLSVSSLVTPQSASAIWAQLEASQILPTKCALLNPSLLHPNLGNKSSDTPSAGIIRELYSVELADESYPVTEGFLALLSALITHGGCDANLGRDFRRPGTSPYVDFVVDHVLAGLCDSGPVVGGLRFQNRAEKWRLMAGALSVVKAVVERYDCVGDGNVGGPSQAERDEYLRDFREEWIQVPVSSAAAPAPAKTAAFPFGPAPAAQRPSTATIPALRPKTPAFSLLSSVLTGGRLLTFLLSVLSPGVDAVAREAHETRVAAANAVVIRNPYVEEHTIMKDVLRMVEGRAAYSNDSALFRAKAVKTALGILNDIAAREKAFVEKVRQSKDASGQVNQIMPVLQVLVEQEKKIADNLQMSGGNNPSAEKNLPPAYKVRVTGNIECNTHSSVERLNTLLLSASAKKEYANSIHSPLANIGCYIQCHGSVYSPEISEIAMKLFRDLVLRIPVSVRVPSMFAKESSPAALAAAFSKSLLLFEGREGICADALAMLIDQLEGPAPTLSHYLLGLAPEGSGGSNCLDAVLQIMGDENMLTLHPNTSVIASRCYELLYKLMSSPVTRTETRSRLCETNFFSRHLVLLDPRTVNLISGGSLIEIAVNHYDDIFGNTVLHGLSWLLKGVSCELFAAAQCNDDYRSREILATLFGASDGALNLLRALPVRAPGGGRPTDPPPKQVADILKQSVVALEGDQSVMGGFRVVDINKLTKLRSVSAAKATNTTPTTTALVATGQGAPIDAAVDWSNRWNRHARALCSSAHIASAWSMLITTAISCTLDALTGPAGVIDAPDIGAVFAVVADIIKGSEREPAIEAQPALHIAKAALHLAHAAGRLHVPVDENVIASLASAVSSSGNDDVSGVLACALAVGIEGWHGGAMDVNTGAILNKAAACMMDLSCGSSIAAADAEKSAVNPVNRSFARTALQNILTLSSSSPQLNSMVHRCMSRQALQTLVSSCVGDPDACWSLVELAVSLEGARSLVECGIGAELIRSCGPEEEIGDESAWRGAAWTGGNQGAVGSEEERQRKKLLFFAQLKIFGALLCHLPNDAELKSDCCKFIKTKGGSCVEMLRNFPKDVDELEALINVLEMVSGGSGCGFAGIMGRVGNKLEQGALNLGLHLATYPLRSTGHSTYVNGNASDVGWWSAIKLEDLSEEVKGVKLPGLFDGLDRVATGWWELDYENACAAARIAVSCVSFCRGRVEIRQQSQQQIEDGALLMIDSKALGRALDEAVKLSRQCQRRIQRLTVEHSLTPALLPRLMEEAGEEEIARLQDENELRVLVECRFVLLLGVDAVRLCENLLALAALQLNNLEQAGGGGDKELGRGILQVLEENSVGTEGLGRVLAGEGGAEGGDEFVKKLGRCIWEKVVGVGKPNGGGR
jgi:hypothetical protein